MTEDSPATDHGFQVCKEVGYWLMKGQVAMSNGMINSTIKHLLVLMVSVCSNKVLTMVVKGQPKLLIMCVDCAEKSVNG